MADIMMWFQSNKIDLDPGIYKKLTPASCEIV
jgi:hypothetical protein